MTNEEFELWAARAHQRFATMNTPSDPDDEFGPPPYTDDMFYDDETPAGSEPVTA